MSLYQASVPQFIKMLHNLEKWIDKAVAYASTKNFDPAVFLTARLAPDQYSFTRQVQAACDSAKFPTAYLSGKEAPRHPDTEQTIEELRARIKKCIGFLESVSAADFEGSEARMVALPFLPGKLVRGDHYLTEMALPNFYFHLATAYDILRHNGVDVGKRDFIGGMTLVDA